MEISDFRIRPMTAADAQLIAAWRYPGEYAFYNADSDPGDLAELLNPAEWGQHYFAAELVTGGELAGFVVVKLTGAVAEIGLGLRPDLTDRGNGAAFVGACVKFATEKGARSHALSVAAFNRRAISVYERAGFRKVGNFVHFTNGGLHSFVRMVRDPAQPGR